MPAFYRSPSPELDCSPPDGRAQVPAGIHATAPPRPPPAASPAPSAPRPDGLALPRPASSPTLAGRAASAGPPHVAPAAPMPRPPSWTSATPPPLGPGGPRPSPPTAAALPSHANRSTPQAPSPVAAAMPSGPTEPSESSSRQGSTAFTPQGTHPIAPSSGQLSSGPASSVPPSVGPLEASPSPSWSSSSSSQDDPTEEPWPELEDGPDADDVFEALREFNIPPAVVQLIADAIVCGTAAGPNISLEWYRDLGLTGQEDCPLGAIKKAYRAMALQHHPDKNQGDAAAAQRFAEYNKAYEVLSDPGLRGAYDALQTIARAQRQRREKAAAFQRRMAEKLEAQRQRRKALRQRVHSLESQLSTPAWSAPSSIAGSEGRPSARRDGAYSSAGVSTPGAVPHAAPPAPPGPDSPTCGTARALFAEFAAAPEEPPAPTAARHVHGPAGPGRSASMPLDASPGFHGRCHSGPLRQPPWDSPARPFNVAVDWPPRASAPPAPSLPPAPMAFPIRSGGRSPR
eukprot:EG_transcript_3788